MIQCDNIRNFAIAAFRAYGHIDELQDDITLDDFVALWAARQTIMHFINEGKVEIVEAINKVYCELPLGHLQSQTITMSVIHTANDMYKSDSTIWKYLKQSCKMFNKYYTQYKNQQLL